MEWRAPGHLEDHCSPPDEPRKPASLLQSLWETSPKLEAHLPSSIPGSVQSACLPIYGSPYLSPRLPAWSGFPCLTPGDLPDPGIKPKSLMSPALAGRFFTTSAAWEAPEYTCTTRNLRLPGYPHPENLLPQSSGLIPIWLSSHPFLSPVLLLCLLELSLSPEKLPESSTSALSELV